jgi:hypothetical protein
MWELGLLKESMEAHVIQEKGRELFTGAEVQETSRRLEELGYFKVSTKKQTETHLQFSKQPCFRERLEKL